MRGRSMRVTLAGVLSLALTVVLAVAVAVLLGGSGNDDAPLAGRPLAPAAVRQAVKALAAENDGGYALTLHLGGRTITESGHYVLSPAATSFTRRTDDGQGHLDALDAVGVDGLFYVKDPQLSDGGCWLGGEPTALLDRTAAVYGTDQPLLPGAIVVAASAHGTTYVDDRSEDVNGSLDLVDVLRLAGRDLPGRLGVEGGRINAELHIRDGVLVGFSVASRSFATTSGLPRSADGDIGRATLEVSFDDLGTGTQVTAPPAEQTVVVAPPDRSATAGPLQGPTQAPAPGTDAAAASSCADTGG